MVEKLMKPEDVAETLGVTVATLAKWRAAGRGPRWVELSGEQIPRYRYRPEDVEAWLEAQGRGPAVGE
jgi:predicted site-specific integrase-resolvase